MNFRTIKRIIDQNNAPMLAKNVDALGLISTCEGVSCRGIVRPLDHLGTCGKTSLA